MKIAKLLIASFMTLLLAGSLAAFGNVQLSQSQSSGSNFSAYPLPGTPIPGGSAPIATPTRAAYPLPGARPPVPKPGAPSLPLTFTAVSTSYLPLIYKAVGPKGTAGTLASPSDVGYTSELTMGVQWGYQWNAVYSKTSVVYSPTFPYQVVNDIRSAFRAPDPPTNTGPLYITWNSGLDGCPGSTGYSNTVGLEDPTPAGQAALQACVGDIAHSRPGLYWMVWNEPDSDAQDNISPSLAISYFVVISNTILKNDPTARLIVGNMNSYYPAFNNAFCGIYWLSHFITEGHNIGITVTDFIAGYGFHAYPQLDASGIGGTFSCGAIPTLYSATVDPCLMSNFTLTLKTTTEWLAVNDPDKELWLTEFNWWPNKDGRETYDIQKRRMGQMCNEVKHWRVTRYGWFLGAPDPNNDYGVLGLCQYPYTGAVSPAGVQYASC